MEDSINKDIIDKLSRIEVLMHRFLAYKFKNMNSYANPHKGQGRVLSILKLQPEIPQKQLGYLLGMRNQSLGELLTKLEKSGYVERTPSEADRRAMIVKLTEEGKKAAEAITETEEDSSLLEEFSDEDLEQFDHFLTMVIAKLEQKVGDEVHQDFHGFNDPRFAEMHARFHGYHFEHGGRQDGAENENRGRPFGREGRGERRGVADFFKSSKPKENTDQQ